MFLLLLDSYVVIRMLNRFRLSLFCCVCCVVVFVLIVSALRAPPRPHLRPIARTSLFAVCSTHALRNAYRTVQMSARIGMCRAYSNSMCLLRCYQMASKYAGSTWKEQVEKLQLWNEKFEQLLRGLQCHVLISPRGGRAVDILHLDCIL